MSTEQETQTKNAMTAHWMHAQMWAKLPYPTEKFTGQTIIVTGSNVGMGLEAARHFVRLDAEKVILAVRNIQKGEAAKKSIIESEKRPDSTVEVWELDLASYASTKAFVKRVNRDLKRLDVVVANAGIYVYEFEMAEEDESTITVNNVSTFLMGIGLLPKLRETSIAHKTQTVLTFTGSFVHYLTEFPEQKADNIFKELAEKGKARMGDR
jgi:retinol dehydrogenase-12